MVETESKLSDFKAIRFSKFSFLILERFLVEFLRVPYWDHLFLIYVDDMPQAVKSNLLLYADDSCLMYQHKDIAIIKKILNEDFENICDWFVDNKFSIHFRDDYTKSIYKFINKFLTPQLCRMLCNALIQPQLD